MKKIALVVSLLFTGLISFTQSNWVTKELGNRISVKFPDKPLYSLKDKAGTYTYKTANNLLVAIVQYDVIPHYTEFLKLPIEHQDKLVELFLDNTVKGLLIASGSENADFHNIVLGTYKGRETYYSSIIPISGEHAMKFCKMFYAFNKVYMFQCMYLNNENDCKYEKDVFLTSITLN